MKIIHRDHTNETTNCQADKHIFRRKMIKEKERVVVCEVVKAKVEDTRNKVAAGLNAVSRSVYIRNLMRLIIVEDVKKTYSSHFN